MTSAVMLIEPDFYPGADLGLNEGLESQAGFELSLEIKGGELTDVRCAPS